MERRRGSSDGMPVGDAGGTKSILAPSGEGEGCGLDESLGFGGERR